MAIPNCQDVIQRLANEHPQEWRDAHNPSGGGPHTEAFVKRVAWVLHSTVDKRWGLNGKRGNPNDLSDDAINWIGEGPGYDPATGKPVTVVDFIARAGGNHDDPDERNRPAVYWGVIDQPGPGAWVKPEPVGEIVAPPEPSGVWTPHHEAIRQRMAGRSARNIAEQLAHTFPAESWGEKRTQGGAASPDTIGRLVNGRLYGVRVVGAFKEWGYLDGQVHIPVAPVNHLGTAPPVTPPPVEPPPVVVPPAVPPDVATRDHVLQLAVAIADVTAKLDALSFAVEQQRQEVLNAVKSQSYDIDASAGYLGRVRGTIKPKGQA